MSGYLTEADSNCFAKLFKGSSPDPDFMSESIIEDWVNQQIDTAINSLGAVPQELDKLRDSIWSSVLAGKLGDGTPSASTSSAIADMVQQLTGTSAINQVTQDIPVEPTVPDLDSFINSLAMESVEFGGTEPIMPDNTPICQKLNDYQKEGIKKFAETVGSNWKTELKQAWENGNYPEGVDDNTRDVLEQIKGLNDSETKGLKKTDEAIERDVRKEEGQTSEDYLLQDIWPSLKDYLEGLYKEDDFGYKVVEDGRIFYINVRFDKNGKEFVINLYGSEYTTNDWTYHIDMDINGRHVETGGKMSGIPESDTEEILSDIYNLVEDSVNETEVNSEEEIVDSEQDAKDIVTEQEDDIDSEIDTSEEYIITDVMPLLDELLYDEYRDNVTVTRNEEDSVSDGFQIELEPESSNEPYINFTVFGSYMTRDDWNYEITGNVQGVTGSHDGHGKLTGVPVEDAETIFNDIKDMVEDLKMYSEMEKNSNKQLVKKENKMNIEKLLKTDIKSYIEEEIKTEQEQENLEEATSKKDFERVAKFLKEQGDTVKKSDLVDFFVEYYKSDNPRFQEERFRAAVEK